MADKRQDTEPAEIADEGFREVAGVVRRCLGGDDVRVAEILHGIDAIRQRFVGERKVRDDRLRSLSDVVIQLASLNFNAKAQISPRYDTIDGLASGLNMLREELQSSTVSKVYLDNIFESMSDALVVANRDGTIRNVNQATRDLLGYSDEELTGKPVGMLVAEQLSTIDLVEVHGRELRCATKHGAEVMVSWSASLLRGGDGKSSGFVCVLRDITEKRRAEEERMRLEDAIRAQAELIRKMSTPLIPINDEVVVMPLVGALDRERADQVVESLLNGIAARHPRMAILDITAVAFVDADVASTIVRAANAARLLGVGVILTGVRPEVARTLVELGFDLGSVIACGTLQGGIALSMKREAKPRRF